MPALTTAKGRHELFCNEYIVDLNGAQAAIRTGYSERTARSQASTLLTNPNIQARVEELKAERLERTKIDADWMLKRLSEEVTADIADLYHEDGGMKSVHEWPMIWRQGLVGGLDIAAMSKEDEAGLIIKLKLSDRTARLKMLGEHIHVQAFRQQVGLDTTETPEQWLQRKAKERDAA